MLGQGWGWVGCITEGLSCFNYSKGNAGSMLGHIWRVKSAIHLFFVSCCSTNITEGLMVKWGCNIDTTTYFGPVWLVKDGIYLLYYVFYIVWLPSDSLSKSTAL